MKTFASAVAGIQPDLDDLGRDEALRFAASMASRTGSERPATYQAVCPGQFLKILAAAGLRDGQDYSAKLREGRPGLVAWRQTSATAKFLASVRAAPAFETLVASADGSELAPASDEVRRYNGDERISPDALWRRLDELLANVGDVPQVVRETIRTRSVAGHKVVLPPVWMLERLALPNAGGYMFRPLSPDTASLLEVPLVRHVRIGEVLHGLDFLVEMPPIDMYLRPTHAESHNPLMGYLYQDAEMAADTDGASALIVASSAVLDLDGPLCVSRAALLADGPAGVAAYAARTVMSALGVNVRVLHFSLRGRFGAAAMPPHLERMSHSASCPFTSRLTSGDVVVNFVMQIDPDFDSVAPGFEIPDFTEGRGPATLPAPVFTGYVPAVQRVAPPSPAVPPTAIAPERFGTLWRFAVKSPVITDSVDTMSAWLASHDSATVDCAPKCVRHRLMLLSALTQMRRLWQESGTSLVSDDAAAQTLIVRGAFPAMLGRPGDARWRFADGRSFSDAVKAGAFDEARVVSPDVWRTLQGASSAEYDAPAIVFATNLPSGALPADERLGFCRLLSAQAYKSFVLGSKEPVGSPSDVDGTVTPDDATMPTPALKWVFEHVVSVSRSFVHVEIETDSRNRLVALVVFAGALGRLAMVRTAQECGCLTKLLESVTPRPQPVEVRASGPDDAAATAEFMGILASRGVVGTVIGASATFSDSESMADWALSRSAYLMHGSYEVT